MRSQTVIMQMFDTMGIECEADEYGKLSKLFELQRNNFSSVPEPYQITIAGSTREGEQTAVEKDR